MRAQIRNSAGHMIALVAVLLFVSTPATADVDELRIDRCPAAGTCFNLIDMTSTDDSPLGTKITLAGATFLNGPGLVRIGDCADPSCPVSDAVEVFPDVTDATGGYFVTAFSDGFLTQFPCTDPITFVGSCAFVEDGTLQLVGTVN